MKKEKTRKIKIGYIITSVLIVAVSVLFSVFRFRGVAARTLQAFQDFGRSVAYYATELFLNDWLAGTVTPTVQEIPEGITSVLPIEFGEFKLKMAEFGRLLISWENVRTFLSGILGKLYPFCKIIVFLTLPVLLLFLMKKMIPIRPNNRHGESTKPFKAFAKFEDFVIRPIIGFCKGYIAWLKDHGIIWGAFALIWAYNLNLITIVVEAVAYLFYFSVLENLKPYTQVAKLAIDLVPAVTFIPTVLWFVIAYLIFNHIRRSIGYRILESSEAINQQFLEDYPGNYVIVGKPRAGKTQTGADMQLSQGIIFREKAHEKMFERHMEFPYFKWDVLEQTIRNFRKNIGNFNLWKLRNFLLKMQEHFEARAIEKVEESKAFLDSVRRLGYIGNDFIFDYDYKRYGMEYDDNLRIVNLWDTVKRYAEEYYIYTNPTPLIIGNFSVREDIDWVDYGNHPLLQWDFFRSNPRESFARSQYAHNLIYDSMRLGSKVDPDEPYQNALEFGCIGITEAGKEFGNQNSNAGIHADSKKANVKNDLLTTDMKMHSHGATIDYYTYFRIIMDEQRAGSIMADITELGQEVKIVSKSKPKIVMPGFTLEEALYRFATEKFRAYYEKHINLYGGMSLRLYFATRLYSIIYNHYTRVYNTFSRYVLRLKVKDNSAGENEQDGDETRYYICTKKTYADRYDTTSFASYYEEKWKHSEVGGINQIPQYSSIRPTIEELRRQGSYNVRRLDKVFYGVQDEEADESQASEKAGKKRKSKKKGA